MGYNTLVLLHNDSIGEIKKDPEFATRLTSAMTRVKNEDVYVNAGHDVSAAKVVCTQHADHLALIEMQGNTANVIDYDVLSSLLIAKKKYEDAKQAYDKLHEEQENTSAIKSKLEVAKEKLVNAIIVFLDQIGS